MDPLTLLAQAKEKAMAGDIVGSRALREQAAELKAIALESAPPAVTVNPADRLPFAAAETETPAPQGVAIKMIEAAHIKKYGDLDRGMDQIYKELYGVPNYAYLLSQKMNDLNRYAKTGIADSRLMRQVLLSQEQIASAYYGGVPVNDGSLTIKATMVEAQDVLLGYLVPEELNMEMIQRLPGLTVVRGLARKFTTSRDGLSFIVRRGGNARFIGNMRSKQTSESPTSVYNTNALFGKINIPVHVNLFKVPVSKSGLEDSAMDVMSQVIMPEASTEGALTEDSQFLTGTGADEPQGILKDLTTGGPWNTDTVTQKTGQAADVAMDAFVKAPWKLNAQYRAKRNPSTAWAFTAATGSALSTLKDSTGAYLWTEMHGNNAQGNPDTLRGWQYRESEALPEIGTNTYPAIFGDFSGYRIVDRVGMSIQRYDDSVTADTDSVVFFVRRRYGGQVAEGWKFVVVQCASPIN